MAWRGLDVHEYLLTEVVTIAGKDGDDARRHLEKTVQKAIDEVNQWRKVTDT